MKKQICLKSNQKGFTLVELIAVIVLLSIIVTLAAMSVSTIKSKVNEKEYENLVSTIKTAARGYAEETGVNKMFVQTLIDKGLIEADDETKQIYDPRDSSSLNCQVVTFENGEATVSESKSPECNPQVLGDSAIKIQYKLIGSTVKKDLPNTETWQKTGMVLSVAADGINLSGATYKWTTPLAPDKTSTSKEFTIDDDFVNDTYQVTVTVGDRKYTAYGKVNIDKRPPAVVGIDYNTQWTKENKTVTFTLSDYNGSGVEKIYVGTSSTCSNSTSFSTVTSNKYTKTLANGTYYICVKDKAGNFSGSGKENENTLLRITTVDKTPTRPTITASDGISSGVWHNNNFTLSFYSTNIGGSPVTYYWGYSTSSMTNTGESLYVTTDTYNKKLYVKACNQVGMCSTNSSYNINPDTIKPTVTITSGNPTSYTTGSVPIKATLSDGQSGIRYYAVTTSSNTPSSYEWKSVTRTSSYSLTNYVDSNGYYYIWAKDMVGNTNYSYVYIYTIDNEGPVITDSDIDFDCDSYGFSFTFNFWARDDGIGTGNYVDYDYKVTESSRTPTSGWKSPNYSYNDLECGVRYYIFIKAYDLLGNYTIERIGSIECDDCLYDDWYEDDWGDDDDDDGGYTPPSVTKYDHVSFYSNKSTCAANEFSSGTCTRGTFRDQYGNSYNYSCSCCLHGGTWENSTGMCVANGDHVRYYDAMAVWTDKYSCQSNGYLDGVCSNYNAKGPDGKVKKYQCYCCKSSIWDNVNGRCYN